MGPDPVTGTAASLSNVGKSSISNSLSHIENVVPRRGRLDPFVSSNDAVQHTTDDAAVSKLSAISAGYYEDPFLKHVVRRSFNRSPLINRGYYSRVAGMRKVILQFIESFPEEHPIQVVNLGSGLDTTYFWLKGICGRRVLKYFEVDFPEVISRKVAAILRSEDLWKQIADDKAELERSGKDTIKTEGFTTVAVDMRETECLNQSLKDSGFSNKTPTLFICECVLVYMQAAQSDKIVRWAATASTEPSCMVVYEQVNPDDAFGRTMVRNLEARGCPLLGVQTYPTLQAQKERFLNGGWAHCAIADMNDVYDLYLDRRDIQKIQSLEMFDEIEEWRLFQGHYFIAVSITTPENSECLKPMTYIWTGGEAQELPRYTESMAALAATKRHN